MNAADELIRSAMEAKGKAIAPYSGFRVGAAVETASGRVYTGCNIEASSYSLTICAERVALFKALSEGERDFTRIIIATDTDDFCPPCGACRQVLWDFAPDLEVILVNRKGEAKHSWLRDLYPAAFGKHILREGK
jgi:cytidine deaminase